MQPIRIVAALASLALAVLVLDLIRRRRIKEELWFAWLVVSLGPLACSLWLPPWADLARWLGIRYEPALLFIVGLFFALLLLLHLTTVISSLMRQNQRLAQEIAHVQWRLDQAIPSSGSRHGVSGAIAPASSGTS
jgi:hypothetical protein